MNLTKNHFVQALGVGALIYLLMMGLAIILDGLAGLLQTFASWYRFHGIRYAIHTSVGIMIVYWLLAATFTSKSD